MRYALWVSELAAFYWYTVSVELVGSDHTESGAHTWET